MPQQFKIVFEAGTDGVAYTMGTRVVCSEPWFANNLDGEAAGAVVHELVHVVQQFTGRPHRAPGWLVEGLADYVRWFQYEPPQNRPRVDFARANYTDSYRTTGAFIDYLARAYDKHLPSQLNDICRRGEYTDSAWNELTGKTVEELWREYAQSAHRPATKTAEQPTSGNPIFDGWYADPEGVIFGDTYWIYPTYSAPYDEQMFFDAFSSTDLVTWTKHPRVLDAKSVKWAERAMWAPSVIDKDGKYYLFFGANDIQNDEALGGIGVAVADRPEGPFKDYLGKPLIDKFHNGAQPIDQFVFRDDDGTLLHDLRRLAALQHRPAERRLHRLRALCRRHDLQGDHAGGLRRRPVHVPPGRQVLLHVVGRRLDGPELLRGVRHRRFAVRPVQADRQDPAAGPSSRHRRGPSLGDPRAEDATSTTSSITAARWAKPTATTA